MAVAAADVAETVAPENLAHRTSRDVQAMRALAGVRAALDRTALRWGPTGSVGFELATGVSTATEESDLDLLVRIPRLTPETLAQLAELDRLFADQPARIDCQVETDCGAFALTELIGGEPEILMRAATGPKLVSRAVAMS
jgi:phosphoribosyl-dephospho-CoA transferase